MGKSSGESRLCLAEVRLQGVENLGEWCLKKGWSFRERKQLRQKP